MTSHRIGTREEWLAARRAPLAKIQAYQRRMGWSFPFASSYGSDFNYDFQVGHAKEAWDAP
jgi:predicted dithiol-disulfide oxidoreductase (DUF899 family)